MKTNQVMIRPMGQFKVEQRTKDAYFNATSLLRQWNEALGTNISIEKFIESYIPEEIREAVINSQSGKILLPVAFEPQLRLYAANYDLDLYDKLSPKMLEWEITMQLYVESDGCGNRSISSQQTYLMVDETCGAIKIGKSSDPQFRERTLAAQIPRIKLISLCPKDVERELHIKFKSQRMRGEWFNLSTKEVAQIIKKYGFTKVK